jgi:predicted metal-dependent hydrolase
MATGRNQGSDGEVIVEFQRLGNAVKVSAVDTRTYVEVSIMAPVNATEQQMTETVMRKLAWVQSKGAPPGQRQKTRREQVNVSATRTPSPAAAVNY